MGAEEAAAKDAGQRYRAEAEALHATRAAAALRLDEAVARVEARLSPLAEIRQSEREDAFEEGR